MSKFVAERLLVLFPGALGDFICFLPALERLRQRRSVDLLARAEFADLLSESVRVRSIERHEVSRLFVSGGAEDERVAEYFGAYAGVYSWTGHGESNFARELQRAVAGPVRVFPFRPSGMRLHQTDYYLRCLEHDPSATSLPSVPLKTEAKAWLGAFWRRHTLSGKPVLAMSPGSGAREKNWPIGRFRAVADWWRDKIGGAVVVILGPVEQERGGYDLLRQDGIIAHDLSLARLAALLANSHLYVGNDSGVSHLAAAVGVETVVFFGPSNPSQWAPRSPNTRVLTRAVACSPCDPLSMKECSHRRCLTTLESAEVIRELEKVWEVASLTRGGAEIRVECEFNSRFADKAIVDNAWKPVG